MKIRNLFLCVAYLCLSSSTIFSQDLIVTKEGDSLKCKITGIDKENVYYPFTIANTVMKSEKPVSDVTSFIYDFTPLPEKSRPERNIDYQHFRIAVQGGLSYRTSKLQENIPDQYKSYMKDLKSGLGYGIDVSGFFLENWGLGIKYHRHQSKNSMDNFSLYLPDGSMVNGMMSDNIKVDFIGPSITSRTYNRARTGCLYSVFSLGYVKYEDEGTLITFLKLKGNTIGLLYDLGYDIILNENVALGIQCSFMTAILKEITLTDGTNTQTENLDKENYENLSHLDLSLGLSINL